MVGKPIALLEHKLYVALGTTQIFEVLLAVRYNKESTDSKLLEVPQRFSESMLVVQAQQLLDKHMGL